MDNFELHGKSDREILLVVAERLKGYRESNEVAHEDFKGRLSNHSGRIGNLESARRYWTGAVAAVVFLGGCLLGFVKLMAYLKQAGVHP